MAPITLIIKPSRDLSRLTARLTILADLLGRIVTARPAAFGRLDRLTVDHSGRWARIAARRFASLQQQVKIDGLKQAVVTPVVEIALHGGERRKVLRQHSPLTAGPRD